jgi:hypothetical protein
MYIGGINLSATYASAAVAPFKLGSAGMDADGNEYLFVKASGAAAAYNCSLVDEAFLAVPATTTTSAPGTGAGKRVCVPQIAIADTYLGWAMVKGLGKVLGAASCVKYTQINTTGTAGVLDDDATAGAEIINNIAFSATLTGAAATACVMDHPVVGRTL